MENEIPFELLPNNIPQNDIIKRGESICLEQKISREKISKILAETLKSIKIGVKPNYFQIFESICKIECVFSEELFKKWTENYNRSKNNAQSFFHLKMEKSHTTSLEEKIATKFEERIANSSTNVNNKSQDRNPNFLNDDENNLLSSEIMNFILTELNDPLSQTNQASVANKNSSDTSIVYSNHSHINTSNAQNTSGFGNLTPIRSANDISNNGNNGQGMPQKILTESVVANQQPIRKSISSNEKSQMRGNTPNTDRRLFVNEPNFVNNNVNVNNNNGSKLYKKKANL